jgi:hypothetical protein
MSDIADSFDADPHLKLKAAEREITEPVDEEAQKKEILAIQCQITDDFGRAYDPEWIARFLHGKGYRA